MKRKSLLILMMVMILVMASIFVMTACDMKNGADGQNGTNGKSAYEIYLDKHPEYTGSEQEWLDDLANGRLDIVEETKYTVTFDSKGGSTVPSQRVERLHKAIMPEEPIKEGYDFLGWYIQGEKWVFNGYLVTEDMTLEAVWSPIKHIITIDNANGEQKEIITRNHGETIELVKPTRKGYIFVRWEDSKGEEVVLPYTVSRDETITAIWGEPINLIFNTNGGDVIPNMTVVTNTIVNNLPIPTKNGAAFIGWFVGNKKVNTPFMCEYIGDTTLVAHWRLVETDYEYEVLSDGTAKVIGYTGNDREIVVPTTLQGKTVSTIATSAFRNNANITSIKLGNNVTTLENDAFSGMTALKSIEFNNKITTYGERLLMGSNALECISIPNNINLMSFYDFSEDNIPQSLTTLKITDKGEVAVASKLLDKMSTHEFAVELVGDSWTSIRSEEFKSTSINDITIPSSVTKIGDSAFSRCELLTSINISEGVTNIGVGAFSYCSALTNINIPQGVTEIGSSTFIHCSSLKSINIPQGVTEIGGSAFEYCSSLISINIPNRVMSIDSWTFSNCSSLASIIIPSSVTSIRFRAFNSCTGLTNVFYQGSKADWFNNIAIDNDNEDLTNANIEYNSAVTSLVDKTNDKYNYIETSDGRIIVLKFLDKTVNSVDLANDFMGKQVIGIGYQAFYNCSSLTSIIIPSNVIGIGNYAFSGCSSLTIHAEATSKPTGWKSEWNSSNRPVEWGYKG